MWELFILGEKCCDKVMNAIHCFEGDVPIFVTRSLEILFENVSHMEYYKVSVCF